MTAGCGRVRLAVRTLATARLVAQGHPEGRHRQAGALDYLDGPTLAQVAINGVPLYAGARQSNGGPTQCSVEGDVTHYSAILRAPGEGFVELCAMQPFGVLQRKLPDQRTPAVL